MVASKLPLLTVPELATEPTRSSAARSQVGCAAQSRQRADRTTGVPADKALLLWLREACRKFDLSVRAIYRSRGDHRWPLAAADPADLERQLEEGGHFLPLPTEPAALANVVEVGLVDFLIERSANQPDIKITRGTERGYPDLEISGTRFGDAFHAIDVKVARRAASGRRTQSRITLYTGNTYFRYPQLAWPGTFRPFNEYASHVDLLGIYTLDRKSTARVSELEVIVAEPWRIASRQRSSTTREYIGAVQSIGDLRDGRGEFETEASFYEFWRQYPFKIGKAAQQQLDRLLAEQEKASGT